VTLLVFRAKPSSFKRICHPDRSEAQWRDLRFLSPVLTRPLKAARKRARDQRSDLKHDHLMPLD
jgi:hypothetical protein